MNNHLNAVQHQVGEEEGIGGIPDCMVLGFHTGITLEK